MKVSDTRAHIAALCEATSRLQALMLALGQHNKAYLGLLQALKQIFPAQHLQNRATQWIYSLQTRLSQLNVRLFRALSENITDKHLINVIIHGARALI